MISTSAACDFFLGLRFVAAIGKEPGLETSDGQRRAGAGKSAQVADIGEVGDEEPGEPRAGQLAAQTRPCGGSGPRGKLYHSEGVRAEPEAWVGTRGSVRIWSCLYYFLLEYNFPMGHHYDTACFNCAAE